MSPGFASIRKIFAIYRLIQVYEVQSIKTWIRRFAGFATFGVSGSSQGTDAGLGSRWFAETFGEEVTPKSLIEMWIDSRSADAQVRKSR